MAGETGGGPVRPSEDRDVGVTVGTSFVVRTRVWTVVEVLGPPYVLRRGTKGQITQSGQDVLAVSTRGRRKKFVLRGHTLPSLLQASLLSGLDHVGRE